MISVMAQEKNAYLTDFTQLEKELAHVGSPGLQRVRKSAIARFDELGFPTLDDEEWRFTNVAPIARQQFKLGRLDTALAHHHEELYHGLGVEDGLVFVNGECAQPLNESVLPHGVIVQRLAVALAEHPDLVEPYLARLAKFEGYAFTALNTAFIRDGAFIHVPVGKVVVRPIHLIYVSSARPGEASISHPRTLIVAGANSQVTIVESYVGRDGEVYFTNAVTEVVAGDNALIDHYKVQKESKDAFHVATMQIHQQRSSRFLSHSIALGGALVRNDVNAVLDAESCECTLNGLYMADDDQLIDNHTRIDHAKPHCASHELYKGILDGKSRGVFNGKIHVHQDAQKTDAKQTNKTLLLSDDATIDTKPQLEIYADDVKCTHGATVGQLDADSIYYLRTRGIGLAEARSLLTFAFANDIVSRIRVEPIREHLEELLLVHENLPPQSKEAP